MPFDNHNWNKPETTQLKLKAWVIQPILFLCAVSFLYQNTFLVKEKTPDVFFGLWQKNVSVATYVPNFPTNQTQVLRLGELFGRLEELQAQNLTNPAYLQEASTLLQMNVSEFSSRFGLIKTRLIEMSLEGSTISKILGVFSFVNILWLVGICGILGFFYPFIHAIFGKHSSYELMEYTYVLSAALLVARHTQ